MSPATIRSLRRASQQERSPFARALRIGLVFGVIAVYITVVGILPLISARWIVVGVVSLGHAALIALALGAGAAVAARGGPPGSGRSLWRACWPAASRAASSHC